MIKPFLKQLSLTLEQTPISQSLQGVEWVVAVVQTIHILAVCALIMSMLLSNLKALGVLQRHHVLYPLASSLRLPAAIALVILLLSGLVMIIGEPARALLNPIFQLKMLLLLAALTCSLLLFILQKNTAAYSFEEPSANMIQRLIALTSIGLWLAILFAGRWIAYT